MGQFTSGTHRHGRSVIHSEKVQKQMTKQLIGCMSCTLLFALGCQSSGKHQTISTPTAANTAAQPPSSEKPPGKFSLGRVVHMVAFRQRAEEDKSELLPKKIVELGNAVDMIAAKTGELNVNDPPEVTQQKAQAILDSTQPWESLLTAGETAGLINDVSISRLNQFVTPIRTNALNLVQYGANPQTIAALQQLAVGLKTSYDGLAAMFTHGLSAYQQLVQP